jgi:F-type H+-transporting ATPase subunit b
MIFPDISLLIQLFNFLLMLVVLNYLLYRPIRNQIKQRRETFRGYEQDIASLTSRVRDMTDQMERDLAQAKKDGYSEKDGLKGEGLEEEKKILAEASREAEKKLEQIRRQVADEIQAARDQLRAELNVFSRDLAQKVLGRTLQ